MVSSQIILLFLIKFGTQFLSISLMVEVSFSHRLIVITESKCTLWSSITIVKMISLDVCDEVLIHC